MSPQFHKRSDKCADEIRDAVGRYLAGQTVSYEELAGILLQYHRTILRALQPREAKER